jgi:hypothetical protein
MGWMPLILFAMGIVIFHISEFLFSYLTTGHATLNGEKPVVQIIVGILEIFVIIEQLSDRCIITTQCDNDCSSAAVKGAPIDIGGMICSFAT